MKNHLKTFRGFTLIELIITLAIASILTSVGIPSFSTLIRDGRLATSANDVLTALNFARSEAVIRNVQVTMLKQGGAASEWEGGWHIFTDRNRDGVLNADDTLLKVHEPLSNNYTLRTGGTFVTWVAFLPTGLSDGSAAGGIGADSFRLCDSNADQASSRKIYVNSVGRARVKVGDVVSAACA